MDSGDWKLLGYMILGLFLIFMLSFGGCVFGAHMEASQFNKFSKIKITWWEAIWADYRILPDK